MPNILNINFDLIDYSQAFDTICQWKAEQRSEIVTITNPHSVLMCRRHEKLKSANEKAGLVLPDGAGIIWAANILGYGQSGRVTGPNLMLKLCDWGRKKGLRHYFYGGGEGIAEKLAEKLTDKYPGLEVAGAYCPPLRPTGGIEDKSVIARINETRPDVFWVGLGAPKQEAWMLDHLGQIEAAAMIGVGAAFDFHSGNVKWAPAIVRKYGIEWAWRLAENPKRMWRRNLDSPIFLAKVILQKLKCS